VWVPDELIENKWESLKKEVEMTKESRTVLARPWILPLVIISGLSAAWAAPWTFGSDTSISFIAKTLAPLVIQIVISSLCAIFAFLGKPAWLPLLFASIGIAFVDALGFMFGIWGVKFNTTQAVVLLITALALIPTVIWGRKVVDFSVTTDMPTFNADPKHDDW
jgi:hypothetical protein